MTNEEVSNEALGQESRMGSCLLWFFWGVTMSFASICAIVFLTLLIASMALNAYLGWQLSGYEVVIIRPGATGAPAPAATQALVAVPTSSEPAGPTGTATPAPTQSPLETQLGTLAAIATSVARVTATPAAPATAAPASSPPAPISINPAGSGGSNSGAAAPTKDPPVAAANPPQAEASDAAGFAAPAAGSNNVYNLIPLQGERDSRPAAEHGDLNLKLREPQPIDVELALVDIPGAGIDPNAPRLKDVFEPNFSAAYTIHNWDWGCNCKGDLIKDDHVVLVGIKTTPGEPVYIPTKQQDIFQGKYYAVVLYASEDSLTFVYDRAGTVAHAYAVHYQGLKTDPSLLALYRQSQGNELPGLTLDTPVGTATDELIVAIRDKGSFMDARSRKDWWD